MFKNKTFYILCPRKSATGGPELLHQLCFHLKNDFNISALMCYYPFSSESGMHDAYSNYKNLETTKIIDVDSNYIISPEVFPSMQYLSNFKKINKIIWFLSVDNYYISRFGFLDLQKFSIANRIANFFKIKKNYSFLNNQIVSKINMSDDKILKNSRMILSQSRYAQDFLKKQGYDSMIVSDYIHDTFYNVTSGNGKKILLHIIIVREKNLRIK